MTTLTPTQLRAELLASFERRGIVPLPAPQPTTHAPVRGRALPPDVVADDGPRLTFEQIAARVGIHRDSVKAHHDGGAFPGAVRVAIKGKRWRWEVPVPDVEAWEARRAAKGKAA